MSHWRLWSDCSWCTWHFISCNDLCTQERLISLGSWPVWSESSLSAWRNLESLASHWAHSKGSDQTAQADLSLGAYVILLVLSCCGSVIDEMCTNELEHDKTNKNDTANTPFSLRIDIVWSVFCLLLEESLAAHQTPNEEYDQSALARTHANLSLRWVHISFCWFCRALDYGNHWLPNEEFWMHIWTATWQNQQNDCAPREDSDQPGYPPSQIRIFAVREMGS